MEIHTSPELTEKRIDQMTESVGVTRDGNNWLKVTLDPFSDVDIVCEGYPDNNCGNSIVQKIKKQITVSKPTSIGAVPWDAHIYWCATEYPSQVYDTIGQDPTFWAQSPQVTPHNTGGLCVRTGVSGTPLVESNFSQNVALDAQYFAAGGMRVIGKAFEVRDTTAPLNRQGASIMWRQPSPTGNETASVLNGVTSQTSPVDVTFQQSIPETAAEARLLPGSKTLKSEEGCYVVAVLQQQDVPVNRDAGNQAVRILDSTLAATHFWFTPIQIGLLNIPFTGALSHTDVFLPNGAFFTGLNPLSTLTVDVCWIIERFPNKTNADLVVLARPSPNFDPAALELYGKTACHLPVGTKVADNDAGDWIKNIADTLATFGVPGMPIVKAGVDLFRVFSSNNGKKKTKKMDEITKLSQQMSGMQKQIANVQNKNPQNQQRQNPPKKRNRRNKKKNQEKTIVKVEG
jgi:hypothetical protein